MGNYLHRILALALVLMVATSAAASAAAASSVALSHTEAATESPVTALDQTGVVSQGSSPARNTLTWGLGNPVFGFLLALGFAALIVGGLWRDRAGLLLGALCIASLFILLYASGYAYWIDELRSFDLRVSALALFAAIALYFAARLNRRMIGAAHLQSAAVRALDVGEWLLVGVTVFSLVADKSWSLGIGRIVAVTGAVIGAALIYASLRSWRLGNRNALFAALAWIWLLLMLVCLQVGWPGGAFFQVHGLHIAVAGALMLVAGGYIDRAMSYRHNWARQLKHQQQTGDLLRVERSRRDFAHEVTRLIRTLEPGLYEETILTKFLEHLANMVPFASAAIAVSHRGDLRLVVLGEETTRVSFESILATREQLLQSVCLSDRAAVIHSDDLGINPAQNGASCLGIVPVKADRNEWAGVLLARSGDLEFGLDELELVSDFAHQAYEAVRSAQQFRRVRREAETDALTGLYNRRAVLVRGERSFRKSRSLGLPLSVLFVDVDHFKQINDEWGHAVGDCALQLIGSICGESLRDQDFIGRYGGEEFLAVLPGANAEAAGRVAERLRAAVEEGARNVEGKALALTVSVGISECGPNYQDFDGMLRAADRALYRAKREGRNRVVHHRFMLKGDRVSRPGS